MRLIINALPLLGEESGIGNYTRHIAAGIMARGGCDVTLYYGYPSKKLTGGAREKGLLSTFKKLAGKSSLIRRLAKKALPVANRAVNAMRPQSWDCYFEPNFAPLPNISARNMVITVHDFSCFRYPQWHPKDRVAHMEKYFWPAVQKANHIITVAECIKQEASDRYGIDSGRITAIHHGVDTEIFHPSTEEQLADLRSRYDLPPNFILNVGAIEPRKNLANLILAHAQLPVELRSRFPLLLVGPPGWNNEEIINLMDRHAPYVRLVGLVPLADLPQFYSACDLFAYPSWYEGFGLPVLEAMACARPVLASTAGALVELSGGACVHTPPEDIDAMAAAMRQILEDQDQRSRMASASALRAKAFSWERSVDSHLDLFRRLMSQC